MGGKDGQPFQGPKSSELDDILSYMERNLITGFSVDPEQPAIFATAAMISMAPGKEINYQLSPERWCVGYDDPQGEVAPCPDNALSDSGGRCESCTEKTRILPCLRCTGATCGNPARRKKCVFSDHYVYLACYSETLFKVGVTRVERLERRISEQGAFGAIAIAAAGGQEVRRLEYAVSRAGWPDRVNMLSLLSDQSVDKDKAEELLRKEARRIMSRIPDEHFTDEGPYVYTAPEFPEVPGKPRLLNPETDPLSGTILGMRGGYLILQVDDRLFTISLRGLVGRELTERSAPVAGPAQEALAI